MTSNGEASSVRLTEEPPMKNNNTSQDSGNTPFSNLVSAAHKLSEEARGSQFPTSNSRSSADQSSAMPAPPPLVSFPASSQLPSKSNNGFPPMLPTPYRGNGSEAPAAGEQKYPYNLYYSRPPVPATSASSGAAIDKTTDPVLSHMRNAEAKNEYSSSESDSSDNESRDPIVQNTARQPPAKKQRVGSKPQPPKPSEERPYRCVNGCPWSFSRLSDLRRHMKSHDSPQFHCPFWDNDKSCHRTDGSFNRLDVLKRHLRLVHFVPENGVKSARQDVTGWCKGCHQKFYSNKDFINHCLECGKTAKNATDWKPDLTKGEPLMPGYDEKGARIPNFKKRKDDGSPDFKIQTAQRNIVENTSSSTK